MTVVPDSPLRPGDRFPFVSVGLLVLLLGLTAAGLFGWPEAGYVGPDGHFLILAVFTTAVVEYALGRSIFLISLVICGLVAAGLPLLLIGEQARLAVWLPLTANTLLGLNLGLFLDVRTRPLFFLPGPLGQLTLNWIVLLALWVALEAAWWFIAGSDVPFVIRLQCFAIGLLIGVSMNALSLIRPSMINPDFIEHRLDVGLGQVQELIDQHQLKKARRLLAQLSGMAPDSRELKQLNYAAWKYDPSHAEFHKAAGALLDRRETDEETTLFVDRMYADYTAVTQGQPKLPVGLHLRLAGRFAVTDKVDEAANIVNVHLQRGSKDENIPATLVAVAEAYLSAGRPNRSAYFADTLVGLFPSSPEARVGRRILEQIAKGES